VSTPSVADAARNNAAWCDIVCRTHGGGGAFSRDAWSTPTRSPQFYPDAVTLDTGAGAEQLLTLVDASTGCSIKDSFATLDLTPAGFGLLFEAEWICRPTDDGSTPGISTAWQPITDPGSLVEWETAWAGSAGSTSLFRPQLLEDPNVVVLGNHVAGEIVEGVVLNRGADVIGLTNLFTRRGDLDAAWNAATNTASALFPNEAIVGYESGSDLSAARRHGFVSLGPLLVWMND
jgi:hypothetical protein